MATMMDNRSSQVVEDAARELEKSVQAFEKLLREYKRDADALIGDMERYRDQRKKWIL